MLKIPTVPNYLKQKTRTVIYPVYDAYVTKSNTVQTY